MDSVGGQAGGLDRRVGAPPNPTAPVRPHVRDEKLPAPEQPGALTDPPVIEAGDFQRAFDEPLDRVLDVEQWDDGFDMNHILGHLEEEVRAAIAQEDALGAEIRKVVLPQIAKRPNAPKGAGVFRATRKQLEETQARVLFNGAVEACDGTRSGHDTLPLTITQLGVCLVSYLGKQGAWAHRLFRRDMRMRGQNLRDEALEFLQYRDQRAGIDQESQKDRLSELLRRGIMSHAERAVLLKRSSAPWRMGHGQPAPYELLTGSGSMELLRKSLDVLSELVLTHKRFVFVPSAPSEGVLLTIGHALRPLEFAVVETMQRRMDQILNLGHLRNEHRERAEAFTKEAGPDIMVGVYRTYAESPPQIFYAHADFVQDAALIAMADSLLQPQRSFPTLIGLADTICASLFGAEGFNSTIQSAYAKAGYPLRYLGERETRR